MRVFLLLEKLWLVPIFRVLRDLKQFKINGHNQEYNEYL